MMASPPAAILIGVLGSAVADAGLRASAIALGRAIAEHGWWLVCGGLTGVMEAACQGAREAGGHTLGILPGVHRDEANAWVEVPVVTGIRDARNTIIARTAHACIALPGAHGTLSEIAFCLKFGTPVVGLQTETGLRVPHAGIEVLGRVEDVCSWVSEQLTPMDGA